jgi:hypothetical protein
MTTPWDHDRRRALSAAAGATMAILLLALAVVYVRVGILHRAPSAFYASAMWGGILLASFAGWGGALNALLFPRDRADWGLRCAWGWAAMLVVGGALCSVSLAKTVALVFLVGLGLVGLGFDVLRAYRSWSKRNVWRSWVVISSRAAFALGCCAIFSLGLLLYLAAIVNATFNQNDDTLCYFGFAREILQTGTLSQPFSFRRISVYGGQSLLDALQLAIPVPDLHLHLLDNGMAVLAVMALIVGQVKSAPRISRAVVLLLLLLTPVMPEVRMNTSAAMTGAVLFLGLYRTAVWPPIQRHSGLKDIVPLALLSVGACTLRQNYLAPVGIFLALHFGAPILKGLRLSPLRLDPLAVRRALVALGAFVLFIAPWWAMSQRWCRSFLFPIIRGNYNEDYDYFRPLSRFAELSYIWQNATYCYPVKAVPLFLTALLTTIRRSGARTLVYFCIAAFGGVALLIQAYPDIDAPNLGRYYFGFTFPALVAIALMVAELAGRKFVVAQARADRAAGLSLILAGIALQLYTDHEQTKSGILYYLSAIQPEVDHPSPWVLPKRDPNYVRVQDSIPPGAPVIVLVDQDDQFDFHRNPIASLDMVGAISPRPGMPLFGPANGVADYFVSLGYRYAIVVHPDKAGMLYRRDTWQHQENALDIWRRTARFYLRTFDVFDELRATRAHVADSDKMTALDLTRRTK